METVNAKQIGRKGSASYVSVTCPDCGKERYVRRCYVLKEGYTGCCIPCAVIRHRVIWRGSGSPSWRGGRRITAKGYVELIITADSPYFSMARSCRRVFEHRLVMAQHLGRPLESWEIVHHKNGDTLDNRIDNLELLPHQSMNVAYAMLEQEILTLRQEVAGLKQENRLIRFHLKELMQSQSRANPANEAGKCVETIDGASSEKHG